MQERIVEIQIHLC